MLRAGTSYEEVAVHDFDEPLMATPAIADGVLYVRTPKQLVAIGAPPSQDGSAEAGD